MAVPNSPYKFLDYYRLEDAKIFFGREREIQVLLSDIVINRLVILFAKTGMGKTSLINAGVRPHLYDRDYESFFIRVRKDPVEAARAEVRAQCDYEMTGDKLASQLEYLVKKLGKPIVLFFDQFEEFFIHIKGDSKHGREFIADMAGLYKKKDSGVHLVFSMREEFLYEMDHFRDVIPTIFHKDSTLRLRGFNKDQARDAILRPAAQFNCEIEGALVNRLTVDLLKINKVNARQDAENGATGDEIEPTQLQIVCDTLWQKRSRQKITLTDYLKLNKGDEGSNIAQQILDQRLEEEFAGIKDDGQLKLLDRLLPLLRTEENTKNIRDLDGLVNELKVEKGLLEGLLEELKTSRLIQESGKEDSILIEFSHDYLADAKRMKYLQDRVRSMWLERIRKRGELVTSVDLEEILANLNDWRLNRTQASFLFCSSITQGWHMRPWYEQAVKHKVGVGEILREKLDSIDEVEAANAVDLLRELQDPDAVKLLGRAMRRKNLAILVRPVLEVAAQSKKPEVASEAQKILAKFPPPAPSDTRRVSNTYPEPEDSWKSGEEEVMFQRTSAMIPAYAYIREMLFEGQIIPFLGAGASLSGRPLGVKWTDKTSGYMPTAGELAEHLARKVNFQAQGTPSLVEVAQYYRAVAGDSRLKEELDSIFNRDYEPAKLHHFLADIPRPLLIVTSNYDDLIERAFESRNRPYDVVTYTTGQTSGETLLWRPYGRSEPLEVSSKKLDIDLNAVTVIYKIGGSVDRQKSSRDSYVITEDDYIDFFTRMSKNQVIPNTFAEPLHDKMFLFIGYSLRDWNSRALLNRLEKELRRSKRSKSWAIQYHSTPVEVGFWQSRRVEVYDISIDEFVERLASS